MLRFFFLVYYSNVGGQISNRTEVYCENTTELIKSTKLGLSPTISQHLQAIIPKQSLNYLIKMLKVEIFFGLNLIFFEICLLHKSLIKTIILFLFYFDDCFMNGPESIVTDLWVKNQDLVLSTTKKQIIVNHSRNDIYQKFVA